MLRAIASDYSERIRVRIAAVSGLGKDDQDILERIAAKPFDPDPRTDADLYYDPGLKAAAVSRLTDELRLRGYLHDEDFETRIAALLALNDQEMLKKAAENTDWPIEIRLKAIKQIKDQKYLAGFAMNHECTNSDEIRLAAFAASRVYAAKNLAEIAMGSDDPEVSEAAAGRLHSDEWILKIIREIKDHTDKWASSVDEDRQYVYEQEIMMTAADNIEDPGLLVMLLLDDPGEYYGMNNFKEHGIELLCRSERMLRYVKMEEDDRALSMAAKCSMDESVLGALAAGKDREAAAIASRKLGYIGRIGEIGLKKKDEKVRLWQDILERSSFTGVRMLSEYAEGDNLTLAKLWLLWLHHSGTMLSVHVKDGEPYESWNRSEDIAEKALQNSIDRVMRDHARAASEMAELRAFDSECEKGAYRESEIEALLPDVFQEIYDAAVLEEIAVQAVKSIDYVRFKILSLVDARREEAEEPYCGSVPPEGLDEFEYIDWKITH